MNKLIIPLTLASLACMTTISPAQSAISAAGTPPLAENVASSATQTQTAEPEAGAVFDVEIPKIPQCAIVTAIEALNIRDEPGGTVIGWLRSGDVVQVIEQGEWSRIEHEGVKGYARARYLELEPCAP